MPTAAQAKLLRFLEDSTLKRVGGTTDVKVDVRVIAATNRDLEKAIDDKTFRSDLYYRLKVLPVQIPPLRERPEDVAPLADYFIKRLARDLKRDPPGLTNSALKVLEAHTWPGNVRELRNVLERALILEATEEVRTEHLPAEIRTRAANVGALNGLVRLPAEGIRIMDVEASLVRQALARTGGNVTKAAKLLGLTRDTLRYRITKYDL